MRIAHSLEELLHASGPAPELSVTIGNFDGVHLGHQALIREVLHVGAQRSVPSLAVTFNPHPATILREDSRRELLTPLPRKLELLAAAGLDTTLVLPFTQDMAAMPPEIFVRDVLLRTAKTIRLTIGFNFALGRERAGDFTVLRQLGESLGFSVTRTSAVVIGNESISSSMIRKHIQAGDMAAASAALGRPHGVDGEVISGKQRGRLLGFPTANLRHDGIVLPPPGAYATRTEILPDAPLETEGALFMSVTSVGTNPTFNGTMLAVETHLLDFSGNLYGKKLRIHFEQRLRDARRFADAQALQEQIGHDIAITRECLSRRDAQPAS